MSVLLYYFHFSLYNVLHSMVIKLIRDKVLLHMELFLRSLHQTFFFIATTWYYPRSFPQKSHFSIFTLRVSVPKLVCRWFLCVCVQFKLWLLAVWKEKCAYFGSKVDRWESCEVTISPSAQQPSGCCFLLLQALLLLLPPHFWQYIIVL